MKKCRVYVKYGKYFFYLCPKINRKTKMGKLNSLWQLIRRYKHLFTLLCVVLFVGVLDDNSNLNRYLHRKRLAQLRHEIELFRQEYEYADKCIKELESNPCAAERIARERYYMKRDNEDVYVVVDGKPTESPQVEPQTESE